MLDAVMSSAYGPIYKFPLLNLCQIEYSEDYAVEIGQQQHRRTYNLQKRQETTTKDVRKKQRSEVIIANIQKQRYLTRTLMMNKVYQKHVHVLNFQIFMVLDFFTVSVKLLPPTK